MLRMLAVLAALAVLVAFPCCLPAQFDEEADLIPGLLGTYVAGGRTIEKIDVTLSRDWGPSAADERLPAGPFTANWESQLLLRQEGTYVFHAFVQGEVSVHVDGETVLDGQRAEPGWISGDPVELDFGLLELEVEFRKTQPAARVHLFWSSDEFPLEPIPPHLLFRAEGRPDLAKRERGRQLFLDHRCNRCHRREGEPLSPPAPSLAHAATGLQERWLVDKLLSRGPSAAHARMPSFGFNAEEAAAVAAYLNDVAEPIALPTLPPIPTGKKAPPDGDLLVKTVGCLACHTAGDIGRQATLNGGDLSSIGEKRSVEWLFQWLANPKSLNADHRMPIIRLTDIERNQIARELASWKRPDHSAEQTASSPDAHAETIRRGKALVERSRCAACHRIPGQEASLEGVPTLAGTNSGDEIDWERSCVASGDPRTGRPVYRDVDREAIRSYGSSRVGPLSPPSVWAHGRSVLERRNCLGCHERDLGIGIVPVAGRLDKSDKRFRGQSQSLIPPSLTAVGDKLHKPALIAAVRGDQKTLRLPWLEVRMPRFDHSAADQTALASFLIGHDRIPSGAPASPESAVLASGSPATHAESPQGEQTLMAGHALTGAGGFNCVACHKFGAYEPRNVALGTKGCDLLMIKDRMRAEFFHRWTRAPLRVVPGMEMPNFNKPVHGVLDGHVDRQLAAVWQAINDPHFTTPTNPTQVEQFLIVRPGEQPRIVRDVFTATADNGGGAVARSFAVGFGNGHSLLIDLDRPAVRGWTLGDFARQRTEGKSWYWDLAGVDVVTGFDDQPELFLRKVGTEEVLLPVADSGRTARLIRYSSDQHQVRFEQVLSFAMGERVVPMTVTQAFEEFSGDRAAGSGIMRTITASPVPDGFELILRKPTTEPILSGAAMIVEAELSRCANSQGGAARGWIFPNSAADRSLRQTFVCTAKRLLTTPKPRPELPRIAGQVTTLPGMTGERLPLPSSIMPTSLAITDNGRLVFTSLKGDVYGADDTDGDGLADGLIKLEEGLAAPFGLLPFRGGLLVAHKPELLWLKNTDGTGPVRDREVWADGWGYSDNYHDWVTGPVRDGEGNLYLGIGSNYSQKERPRESSRWRGNVVRIDPDRRVEPFAQELRYPQGIAVDGKGRLFVSDQQGVANTFNEINHVQRGRRYGVKSRHEPETDAPETRAAVQIPHPWTRSVNGLFFLPDEIDGPLAPFAGHGVGCEYNGKFLVRFTLQEVGGELQGACYYFSRPNWKSEPQTFLGPMCGIATTSGDVYIGSIFDSGWLGGPNTGEIVRLMPNGDDLPNGIRELRGTRDGFEIEFLRPVDAALARDAERYVLSGYTRVWQGSYATPDSGRYTLQVESVTVSSDGKTARLAVDELRDAYVYEVNCSAVASPENDLFPATGHYSMNRIPSE